MATATILPSSPRRPSYLDSHNTMPSNAKTLQPFAK